MDVIRYERDRRPFARFTIRGGIVIRFENIDDAVIMIKEVWWHRVYTRRYEGPTPRVVVDVGANIGFFTLLAKTLWPSCRVYAYEPAPSNFRVLSDNVRDSRVRNVFVCNRAAAKQDGRQLLFVNESVGGHSLVRTNREANQDAVEVSTIDLEGIISTAGHINFLKIDCEGCEWDLLDGKEDLLRAHVDYVAMEYHEISGKRRADMVALFHRAGFDCWASSPDKWNNGMLHARKRGTQRTRDASFQDVVS